MVIAEALACGVPVVTTKGTPWQEVQARNCGWWIENGKDQLFSTLKLALAADPVELRRMGQTGRSWMKKEFNWMCIAKKMKAAYNWLVSGGKTPEYIRLN